jgi:hypothetical protein
MAAGRAVAAAVLVPAMRAARATTVADESLVEEAVAA